MVSGILRQPSSVSVECPSCQQLGSLHGEPLGVCGGVSQPWPATGVVRHRQTGKQTGAVRMAGSSSVARLEDAHGGQDRGQAALVVAVALYLRHHVLRGLGAQVSRVGVACGASGSHGSHEQGGDFAPHQQLSGERRARRATKSVGQPGCHLTHRGCRSRGWLGGSGGARQPGACRQVHNDCGQA